MNALPARMRAMVLNRAGAPLDDVERDRPRPGPHQVLVRVSACGVCRTDLHVVDGELPGIRHPIIPGHEIVGEVVEPGPSTELPAGTRVGVPWLGWTCGNCDFCRKGQENLCGSARFTGYQIDGGYADYVVADERYCFPLAGGLDDAHAAPLLCAGLIGYRSLRMTGDARRIGLYGFGAAAHIVAQVARHQGRECLAFVRPGDDEAARFAREVGCSWAGNSDSRPPVELDAAIIFAPAGPLVPAALAAVRRGGTVVCGGIHMSDIPSFPYALLWGERTVRSVANLTRRDGEEFLALAARIPLRTEVTTFALEDANEALARLRGGRLTGAAVLLPGAGPGSPALSLAGSGRGAARPRGKCTMKVHVKHTLKTDVDSALKLCTDQKHQEAIYAQLGGTDLKIKRDGRSPNVKLKISRKEVANPPAAIRKLVPSTNEVSHTEDWAADGDGYSADIAIDIKGVPVKISGTKSLKPEKGGCSVEWSFDVTSGIPLLGGIIASFAGSEVEQKLEKEFKVLKSLA